MLLDVLIYRIEDDETLSIEGEDYELLATGAGLKHMDLFLVRREGSFLLYDNPTKDKWKLIAECDDLEKLLEETEGERIHWAMRRAEVDDLISRYHDYDDPETYLEEIEIMNENGIDTTEALTEFRRVFGDEDEYEYE